MFFTILKIVTAVGGLLIAGISAIAAARRSSNQGSHTLVTAGAYDRRAYSNSTYTRHYTANNNHGFVHFFGKSIFGFVPCPKVAHTGDVHNDVDNVIDAVNEIGDKVDTLQDAIVQVANNKAMPVIPVVNPAGDPIEDMAVRSHANVVPMQRTIQAPTHNFTSPYPASQLGQGAVIGHNNFNMANGFDQAYDRSTVEMIQRGMFGQQQQLPYIPPALPQQVPLPNNQIPSAQIPATGCWKDPTEPMYIPSQSTIGNSRVEPYGNIY